MPVSPVPDSADQPMKAHDLGVRLPLDPPDGRSPAAPIAPVISVIPVRTPSVSPAGSPRFVDVAPDFDLDSSDEEPDHRASPDANVGPSPLRPKWWAKTLADLRDDELIDGRTARKKSKPARIVNFHSWPTFTVCLNLRHTPRPKVFQSGNKLCNLNTKAC